MALHRLLPAAWLVLRVTDAQQGRQTLEGCECLRTWDVDSFTCNDHCCNPQSDLEGDWCYTVADCGTSNWGTCTPPPDDECDCSCHGQFFWYNTDTRTGAFDNDACQMHSEHLPTDVRFEVGASCCYNWAEGSTDPLRAEHCCSSERPGYAQSLNNTYILQAASDDLTPYPVADAAERCDATLGCSGVTCESASSCTVRTGSGIGPSASGEFSYLKFPTGCTDTMTFMDETGSACHEWEGYNCSEPYTEAGYTEAGMVAVRNFCPRSCRICHSEKVDCPVLTSPEAGTIFVPDVVNAQCCQVLEAFSYSTLAQTDVLPMPWYGIVIMLGITECVVPEEYGGCVEEGSEYQHTADSLAFGNLVRFLCDNPHCNTSNMNSGGIVSLYTGQLAMPRFHEILHNDYLFTNCDTAPLPSRTGSNSALDHSPIYPGPPPLPASDVDQHGVRSRDGSSDSITREVDIYFRVPTTSTTTTAPPPGTGGAGRWRPGFALGLALVFVTFLQ